MSTDAGVLLLSFDIAVFLSGILFDDEDLVRFDGLFFTMEFDTSAFSAFAPGLDLDGAHREESNDLLLLSYDTSGTIGPPLVVFDDEDVVAYDTSLGTFAMFFDASTADPDWIRTDMVAVPEPGFAVSLAAGLGLLAVLGRVARARGRAAIR